MRLRFALCLVSLVLAAQQPPRLQLERIAQGLAQCTDIQSPRDGSGRLFFVQQAGLIRIWRNGSLLPGNFLDLRSRLSSGGERGLLGLAFPPAFAEKQYFYLNYTNLAGNTVISRFRVSSSNPDQADSNSEQILLTVTQPFPNHNGGQLQFGPDGMLYIGLGDGGSANDPQGNGQNPRSLLGKMLRVNVEPNLSRYEVPADNPFRNDARYAPEIWALGLRNPWRFAFDRADGSLFIADVGQNAWEEINWQPAQSGGGENYGWVTMEGRVCVRAGCNTQGLALPVHVYPRTEGLSVSGGYVYRGQRFPWLRGAYLYGDFVTGRFWALRRQSPEQGGQWSNDLLLDRGRSFAISTFGEDEDGELFVANYASGEIFRILADVPQPQLSSAGIVNAASFQPGLVPGSLATAFTAGVLTADQTWIASALPLPSTLGNVTLRLDSFSAPLLAVLRQPNGEQINFQVPWDLSPASSASVVVTSQGISSAPVQVPIVRLAPAVFSRDNRSALLIDAATFALQEAALDRTRIYVLYATGLGPFRAPVANGSSPAQALQILAPLSLTVGGVPADVLYAGSAPGFPGVYQINFRLSAGTPGGPQNLQLNVDGVLSPLRQVNIAP